MLKFLTKNRDLIAEPDALPGRDEAIPVPARHVVLGTPLLPPFPEGIEVVQFGLGCFWGAERLFWQLPGVYSTAVGYSGGFTKNPTYAEVCSGRTGHTEAVLVAYRPEGDLVRRDPAHVLGGSRPDAGHAPGQRHGHAVPLGRLLDDGRAARRDPALARRLPGGAERARARSDHDRARRGRPVLPGRGVSPAVPAEEPGRLLRPRRNGRQLPDRHRRPAPDRPGGRVTP